MRKTRSILKATLKLYENLGGKTTMVSPIKQPSIFLKKFFLKKKLKKFKNVAAAHPGRPRVEKVWLYRRV
jgi:hypothetical protein